MRILYHAINGTSLGHLTRLSTIARALRDVEPDVHQLFVTNSAWPAMLQDAGLPFVRLPSSEAAPFDGLDRRFKTLSLDLHNRLLYHVIEEYRPRITVFDTHFSPRLVRETGRLDQHQAVLVLRKCRPDYLTALHESGSLALFSRVLVPHEPAEFFAGLPSELAGALRAEPRLTCVGPIARVAAAGADRAPFILVTCGAGGYDDSARRFLVAAADAARRIADARGGMIVRVVAGPYAGEVELPSGCEVHRWLPDLPAHIAAAQLVIGHAGCNTVEEILASGARAVLVPLACSDDDQLERARSLEKAGRAACVTLGADCVAQLVDAGQRELGRAPAAARPAAGAGRAAAALLDLAGPPRRCRIAWADLPACLRAKKSSTGGRFAFEGVSWRIDLGAGDEATLATRAMAALGALDAADVPPARRTLFFRADRAHPHLHRLSVRLSGQSMRDLVVLVGRERPADDAFSALEACRREQLGFAVDVTAADAARLGEAPT